MARTTQTARKSTGGKAPRKQLPTVSSRAVVKIVRKRSFADAGLNEIRNAAKRQKVENKKLTKCEQFYSEFKMLQGKDEFQRMSGGGIYLGSGKFDWYNGAQGDWDSELMSISKNVNDLLKQNKFLNDIHQLILSSNKYIELFMINCIISYFIDLRMIILIQHIYNIKKGTFWSNSYNINDKRNEKCFHNLMQLESLMFLSENYVFDNLLFENNAKTIMNEIQSSNKKLNDKYLINQLLFLNPKNSTYCWDITELHEDKISDMLAINNIIKKHVINVNNNNEWELYLIFIPSFYWIESMIDFMRKHKTEKEKQIDQNKLVKKKFNPYDSYYSPENGYKYIVMHNKHENEMIVLWAHWEAD